MGDLRLWWWSVRWREVPGGEPGRGEGGHRGVLQAGHDAALCGRWNLLHLIRLPLRLAVQPVPVREYPDRIHPPPPWCAACSTVAVVAPVVIIPSLAASLAAASSAVTPLALRLGPSVSQSHTVTIRSSPAPFSVCSP